MIGEGQWPSVEGYNQLFPHPTPGLTNEAHRQGREGEQAGEMEPNAFRAYWL